MDLESGQQSRDMTVFIDDDGKGYIVYSSEKNSTTHVAEPDADLTGYTGRYLWLPMEWEGDRPILRAP